MTTYSYKWQRSADGISWSDIAGAAGSFVNTPPFSQAESYLTQNADVGDSVRLYVTDGSQVWTSPPFGPITNTSPDPSGTRWFSDLSLFNMRIADVNPVYYNSTLESAWRTNIKNAIGGINLNGGNGSWSPLINVADASTPKQPVVVMANNWRLDDVPVASNFQWSSQLSDSDKWAAIVDEARGRYYGFFGAGRDLTGKWTTYAADMGSLTGSGWWDSQYVMSGATDASAGHTGPGSPHYPGMSMLAGTIRPIDVIQGIIPHALKHAFPNAAVQHNSWAYPATGGVDGQSTTSGMPYGLRIQFDPTIDIHSSSFTITDRSTGAQRVPNQTELMILEALQVYGSWHCDNTSGMAFYGQNVWNLSGANAFPSWWSWAGFHKNLVNNLKFLQSPLPEYVMPYETR